ncbi:MAG: hypothetical protein COZ06_20895 [Armatimonadetes bacterium CG_4_10_14_3_um_filter_66_18]|nr:MAG: hypothetical protein COZ06_20895 [Armatimonadetes bacterium CG_4_10_14_3_um_filter_66_18]
MAEGKHNLPANKLTDSYCQLPGKACHNWLLREGEWSGMPTVELDLKQLAKAAHQLTAAELREFLRELSAVSRAQFAESREERTLRAAATSRLPVRKQRQLSALLDQADSGMLTVEQQAQLDLLVDEVEQHTLEGAEAMHELLGRGIDARPKVALARCSRK